MPITWSPNPINLPLAGIVNAAGELTIPFGPPGNQAWEISQVSIEMPTAPVGSRVEVRYMNSFVDAPSSAKRASAGGDPPIYLQPGERMTVEWTGCTTGDPGNILVVYKRGIY